MTKDFKIGSIDIKMSESIKETLEQEYHRTISTTGRRSQGGNQSASFRMGESEKRLMSASHTMEKDIPEIIVAKIGLKDISLLTTADKLIKICEKKIEKQQKDRGVQFASIQNRK